MPLMRKEFFIPLLMLVTALPAVSAAEDSSTILLEKRVERVERIIQGQGLMNLISRVDQLQTEVQRLNGENETLRHELEQMKKRQREMYIDLDDRIQQAQVAVPAPEAPVNAEPDVPVISDNEVQSTTPVMSDTTPTLPASSAVPSSSPTVVETGEAAYQAALQTLRSGQYEEAITALKGFPEQYPGSPYLPNAYYWQGEAKYVLREFSDAAALFQIVLDQFPESNKVADALLKRGFSEQEMGETTKATDTLNKVISDYPDSSAAKLAKSRLARIQSAN
jgi:tol-pal system protein YbgF